MTATTITREAGAPGMRRRQSGLTLVEVLVALVVGLILTAGAVQIFASSREGFRTNDAVARIQESGRIGLELLARDIRGAAFWGCSRDVNVNSTLNSGGGVDFTGPGIEGTEGSGGGGGAGGSDTVTIRGATTNRALQLQQAMPTTSAALVVNQDNDVQEGEILMVTDCVSADVFQVTNTQNNNASIVHNSGSTPPSPGNSTQNLSRSYNQSATVFTARQVVYSLQDELDADGNVETRVLERNYNGDVQQLAAGVWDMEITYGVDTGTDRVPDTYVSADQVPAVGTWDDVLAIRIELLVRSEGDNLIRTRQVPIWDFDDDGVDDAAPDDRMYQVFAATTSVRNRLP